MKKYLPLTIAIILIIVAIGYLQMKKPARFTGDSSASIITLAADASSSIAAKAKIYDRAREITTPDGFINTDGITIQGELDAKKVVLLDFWTFSCINCQRTLPYLNAWYEKYKDYGLTIIGMQTPEFDFEKDKGNVQKAVTQYGVKYPVVLDNDFSTWNAYNNQYWPEHYLIDIDGFVTDRHIGEGGYEDTEKKIQALLRERAARLGLPDNIPTSIVTNASAQISANSPETYFGWARNEFLGNGARQQQGDQTLKLPASIFPNTLYLDGTWNFQSEYAVSKGPAKIVYKYKAKNIFFVAHSAKPMTVNILKDGKPAGSIKVKDAGLYDISKDEVMGEHTIELDIPEAGLEAFTFTFG